MYVFSRGSALLGLHAVRVVKTPAAGGQPRYIVSHLLNSPYGECVALRISSDLQVYKFDLEVPRSDNGVGLLCSSPTSHHVRFAITLQECDDRSIEADGGPLNPGMD